MDGNYPFIKCLYPRKIVNPYTHEVMTVPCGHCKACVMRKASESSLKCQMEADYTAFTMFVTLTYDRFNLPRMRCAFNSGTKRYEFSMINRFTDSPVIFEGNYSHDDIELLRRKFNVNGDIPVLWKSDLQLFIKRFRKLIDTLYHEKVRYYACGEYGPKHYRPHYHLLFFFNSKEIAQNFSELLSKAWTLGRVDSSLSQGNCASYVAGYVNSTVSVPSVLKAKQLCPFSTHSFFLGMARYKSLRKNVYDLPFEQVIKYVLPVDGQYITFNVFRSFLAYFFPKCKGYSVRSTSERYKLYTIYDKAVTIYQYYVQTVDTPSCMELAKLIYALAQNDEACNLHAVVGYFNREYDLQYYRDEDFYNKVLQSIYRELSVSKHFLTFVCDNDTYGERIKKLHIIEEFYKYQEYQFMVNNYQKMEELITDETAHFVPLFYDSECEYSIEDTPFYGAFRSQIDERFERSIKHKKLNDANNIFNSI